MGKGPMLHLLAVAAGWGMVAVLRPIVGAGLAGRDADAEYREPGKRVARAPVPDRAAGERLLKRLAAGASLSEIEYGEPVPLAEQYAEALQDMGIDPATFAASYPGFDPTRKDLCYSILQNLLASRLEWHDGRDLRHAFRHGRIEAMEIHDIFAAEPPLAGTELVRLSLYDHLSDLDAARAAILLETLPEERATGAKYWAARSYLTGFTPDSFLALMRTIPSPKEVGGKQRSREAWRKRMPLFIERHGSEYFRWVEQLPAGADRDAAAAALLEYLDPGDTTLIGRIRGLIDDPAFLEESPSE